MAQPQLKVVVVGGGMITHDQLLPSLYHLRRLGRLSDIAICALNVPPLKALAESPMICGAFPDQSFQAFPALTEDPKRTFPDLYKGLVDKLPRHNLVVVAVPDHFHYPVIKYALEHDQHVLTVKPLVLSVAQATEIEHLASQRGLFVGVEYHKRFDRRCLEARGSYRAGKFGSFRCGEAKLVEPWYYRHSNFQTWFTKENTDPFVYIGCHYVDLVYFITGLRPVEVSVQGVEGKFPNGNVGYTWSNGRVRFENGGLLSVVNGLGYPNAGPGSNDQSMTLFCEGGDCGAIIAHNDQFRGVSHGYIDNPTTPAAFRYVNPDYLRLVPWEGVGLKPVGYGYDSVEASVLAAHGLMEQTQGLSEQAALAKRRQLLKAIDDRGIIATPANSWINELVMEAGRLSITHDGARVALQYGREPKVELI